MFRNSESTFFDRKEQYDWEDDFYESFSKGKKEQQRNKDNLWIDWSSIDNEFVEILESSETDAEIDMEADESADESDISFYTALSQEQDGEGEASGKNDDSNYTRDNSDDESVEWEYEMYEVESSDGEDVKVLNVTPDDFFGHVMGKIQKCLDADSDYVPSDDEDEFENASVLKGTLCNEIRQAKDTEERVEIIEKKW